MTYLTTHLAALVERLEKGPQQREGGSRMKRFEDLTSNELVALTETEIGYYCDLACAENGVPFLPPEPVEPVAPEAKPDITMVEFFGYYLAPEHGARVLEAMSSGAMYDDAGRAPYQTLELIGTDNWRWPKLNAKQFYSQAAYDAIQKEVESYTALKSEYDRQKKDFDCIAKERRATIGYIFDAIRDAREDIATHDRVRHDFARYLGLADGNATIAMRFLLKSNSFLDETDKYDDLVQELCPGYGKPQAQQMEQAAA